EGGRARGASARALASLRQRVRGLCSAAHRDGGGNRRDGRHSRREHRRGGARARPSLLTVAQRPTAEYLALAIELADQARAFVRPRFRSRVSTEEKADGSPVTEIDTALEARLRERIRARFPEHGVIGEESGAERGNAEWVWVLDPIDGTQSFILGKPT